MKLELKEKDRQALIKRRTTTLERQLPRYIANHGELWTVTYLRRFADLVPSWDKRTGDPIPSLCYQNAKEMDMLTIPYGVAFPEELKHLDRDNRPSSLLRQLSMEGMQKRVDQAIINANVSVAQILTWLHELDRLKGTTGYTELVIKYNVKFLLPVYTNLFVTGFEYRELTHESMRWRSKPVDETEAKPETIVSINQSA